MSNYYELLSVPVTASQTDIAQAYRRCARVTHPDKNPEKEAQDKFHLIQEAYEVLSNDKKRKLYDACGKSKEALNIFETCESFSTARSKSQSDKIKCLMKNYGCTEDEARQALNETNSNLDEASKLLMDMEDKMCYRKDNQSQRTFDIQKTEFESCSNSVELQENLKENEEQESDDASGDEDTLSQSNYDIQRTEPENITKLQENLKENEEESNVVFRDEDTNEAEPETAGHAKKTQEEENEDQENIAVSTDENNQSQSACDIQRTEPENYSDIIKLQENPKENEEHESKEDNKEEGQRQTWLDKLIKWIREWYKRRFHQSDQNVLEESPTEDEQSPLT